MSTYSLRTAGLALASFLASLLLLWALPPGGALSSAFSAGALSGLESNAFLGSYRWTAPQGVLRVPLRWWTDRAIVRQRLSAGPQPRPLTFDSAQGQLRFTVEAGQLRTYRYLMPAPGGWLQASFTIPPLGPSDADPRELGFIIADSRVGYLAGAGRWPSLGLLILALLVPLAERAGAAWGLGQLRWALALLLLAAVALSYRSDGLQTLALGPTLALGLAWAAGGGWLLMCLRGQLASWPGLTLALSLGFSLVPLFLVLSGLGVGLPGPWPLLLAPALAALALALVPGAARYRAPLAGLAAACALAWAGLYAYGDAILRAPSDFQAYYDAARRLLVGQPLYDIAALAADPFATSYKYPPIAALLITPLALLPLPAAGALWRLICVAAAAAGALALASAGTDRRADALQTHVLLAHNGQRSWPLWANRTRASGGLRPPAPQLIALALIVALSPVIRSLRFGQPELLIFAGAVLGTMLLLRGHTWASAAIWALLALVKIYPLLLILPLLIVGRRRWALALAAAVVGWTALSAALSGSDLVFWRDLFPTLGARDGRLANLAIYGVLSRLVEPAAYSGQVAAPAAGLPALILGGGLYALAALLIWRRRATLEAQLWDALGLMVCTVLLAIPVGWDHYHALLLLPLTVSLGGFGRAGDDAPLWLGAYSLLIFGVSRDIWPTGGEPGALALFFASYRTVGALLLWAWLARRLAPAPPAEGSVCA